MESSVDKYFEIARQAKLPVSLSDIETHIAGLGTITSLAILKPLIFKSPIIMSTITGIVITGTIAILSYTHQPQIPDENSLPFVDSIQLMEENSPVLQDSNPIFKTVPYEKVKIDDISSKAGVDQMVKEKPKAATIKAVVKDTVNSSTSKVEDSTPQTKEKLIQTETISHTTKENKNKPQSHSDPNATGFDRFHGFKYNDGAWALFEKNGYFGMFDMQMNVVVPAIYDRIDKKFKYGDGVWCKIERQGYIGFIDRSGNEIVIAQYDNVWDFKEGDDVWAKVSRNGYFGFIDRGGNEVVPCMYDKVWDFNENDELWCKIQRDGYLGFLDRNGREIVVAMYDEVEDFKYNEETWSKISRNGYLGFIDRMGKEIVPAIYDNVNDFKENEGQWAQVSRDGYLFFLDREGKEVQMKEQK